MDIGLFKLLPNEIIQDDILINITVPRDFRALMTTCKFWRIQSISSKQYFHIVSLEFYTRKEKENNEKREKQELMTLVTSTCEENDKLLSKTNRYKSKYKKLHAEHSNLANNFYRKGKELFSQSLSYDL